MQRVSTTVVALVDAGESIVEHLRRHANIAVYQPDPASEALDRSSAAWEVARRTHVTYFVHDADPLIPVADAWGRHFDGTGPRGELELAVGATLARWRAGSLELPDYYVLCSPEDWSPTRRHWYLGVLGGTCAPRVVSAPVGAEVARQLATLPAGRWWPGLDQLLADVDRIVPDQAGWPGAARSTTRSVREGTPLTTLP